MQEKLLCVHCRHQLRVRIHSTGNLSQVEDRFYGRLPVAAAAVLFHFDKETLEQRLLHAIKYLGREDLGAFFGRWLGEQLKRDENFSHVDTVVAVPQHWRKRLRRGYNQVDHFASAVAMTLKASYKRGVLKRVRHSASLVGSGRSKRGERINPFRLGCPDKLNDKHVLLLDDILTTGITLEHCGTEILKANPASLSLATIAIA